MPVGVLVIREVDFQTVVILFLLIIFVETKNLFDIKQIKNKHTYRKLKSLLCVGNFNGVADDFVIYQGSTNEIWKNIMTKYGLGASVVTIVKKKCF